jgi:Ca2+-binding RTX toxin-like protein
MAALSTYEQYLLELINRARLDPLGEAARLGIDLNQGLAAGTLNGAARQPLAPNGLLTDAARAHNSWMLATDVFSHTGAGGSSPGDRMEDAGYSFAGSWTWGENIAWMGSTGSIGLASATGSLHDNLFRSAGHRQNLLNDGFREIGTGVSTGIFTANGTNWNAAMATEAFARSGAQVFFTGVAIDDADGDNFYDIGEARSGVAVSVRAGSTVVGSDSTEAAGGYAVGVSGGTLAVTFSGAGLAQTVNATVAGGTRSVKVDLIGSDEIASSATTVLGDGARVLDLLGVAAINGTGNALANAIYGNKGDNTLSGLAGNDTLYGGLGGDRLIGGAGRDILNGGGGGDTFDFNAVAEIGRSSATRDRIADFVHGLDDIDLRSIDANTRVAENQAFRWVGSGAFSGVAGQLHYKVSNPAGTASDRTFVEGDVNGDRIADFVIELVGVHTLSSIDFLL